MSVATRLMAIVLLLFSFVAFAVADDQPPPAWDDASTVSALLQDDQCSAEDEACTLNAIQLRGQMLVARNHNTDWWPSIGWPSIGTAEKCCSCKSRTVGWSKSGKCSFCRGLVKKTWRVPSDCTKKSKYFKGSHACARSCRTSALLEEPSAALMQAGAARIAELTAEASAATEDEAIADEEWSAFGVAGIALVAEEEERQVDLAAVFGDAGGFSEGSRSSCTASYTKNCMHAPSCCDPAARCYTKDGHVAVCLRSCAPGIHSNDPPQYRTPWTCQLIGAGGATPKPPLPPPPPAGSCAATYHGCKDNTRCCDPSARCYEKDGGYAACLHHCEPGIHWHDPPRWRTPWSCRLLGAPGPVPVPAPVPPPATPTQPPQPPGTCSASNHHNCMDNPTCCDPAATCYAKDHAVAVCLRSCTPGIHLDDPPQWRRPWSCNVVKPVGHTPVPAPTPAPLPSPYSPLVHPSKGELLTFYMYRAQNDATFALENINAANLEGAMWYLQNEVVSGVYGAGMKFGITRILRFKVQMKATQPLLDRGMNFGVRVAFDSAKCTGPHCDFDWRTFGYNIGCNNLGNYPFPEYDTHYPHGIWYSLPGSCPSQSFMDKDAECKAKEKGGLCASPTGAGDCTWKYERAGELTLEDLYAGTDEHSFWADPNSTEANDKKVAVARKLFAAKYGEDPPVPPCDFNQAAFYQGMQ